MTQCLGDSDPEGLLWGLIFDVLHSGTISLQPEPVELSLYPGGVSETLDRLVMPVLSLLINDENARNSVVIVVSALVRVETAKKFLPDLEVIFKVGVVADVLRVLVALASKKC